MTIIDGLSFKKNMMSLLPNILIICSFILCVKSMTPKSDAMRTKCNIKHASTLGLLSAATLLPSVSNAKVYFDTDTYGDKELKIATVNRIKQKLRNAWQKWGKNEPKGQK